MMIMHPEEIEPRVSAALRLLQQESDDTLFCPRGDFDLDRALLVVTSKALRVGLAVCHLVSSGFYGEAFGLTRTVLEAFFIAKYISSKDSESRAHSYLEFRKVYFYNQEEIRKKHFPQIPRPAWLTQAMLGDVKLMFRERAKTDQVREWAKTARPWPRTNAMLERIARSWDRHAQLEDERVRQDEMRYEG